MNCKSCGNESEFYLCVDCVRKHNDPRTIEIWEKNKALAEVLGEAYFGSVLESYEPKTFKKEDDENFGFTLFCEGANLGLDMATPFLDDDQLNAMKEKIDELIEKRKKFENK